MSVMKRSLYYIGRKKGQTTILFILFIVVSVFLISCFSILDATDLVAKDLRSSVGGAFYLRPVQKLDFHNGAAVESGSSSSISQKMIDEIMESDQIKYVNALNYGYAKSDSIQFIPGSGHNDASNMGKISAMNYTSLADEFLEKKIELVEGRHITKNDKNKILISEQLAKINKLKVGDHIRFTHSGLIRENNHYKDSILEKTAFSEVEIVGIYQDTVPRVSSPDSPTPGRNENLIFSDHHFLLELKEQKENQYTGEVNFYIRDPLAMKEITDKVKDMEIIKSGDFSLRENDFEYMKIADSLSSIQDLTQILMICVSIVSFIILILILTMRIRGRLKEAGILLAIGKTKKEIVTQFILEVLILFVLAFICATAVSILFTGVIENVLLGGLTQPSIDIGAIETGQISEISTKTYLYIKGYTTLLICICQSVVLTMTVAISCGGIFSLKPKEILTKMN